MSEPSPTARILTLVFTDLVSSTALKAEHGDQAAGELVARHREQVRRLAEEAHGRVVAWAGDGCFLTFDTSSAAVLFALRLQRVHGDEPDLPRVRAGIHIGEVTELPSPSGDGHGEVEGLAVDLASRIAGLAQPNQILLSSTVYDSSRSRLDATVAGQPIRWQSHGSYKIKGFDKPFEICEVGLDGLAPFKAPAGSDKATAVATGSQTAAVAKPPSARNRIVAAAVVLVAAFAIAYLARTARQPSVETATVSPAKPITSLAVLPFQNYSGDREQDYFVEGMTEALISELAKIRSIKVISRTSMMQYKDNKKPLPQVARELGVEGLIEGSVYKGGNDVRITAQLIRGATDEHLWAASYTESLENVLKLQSKVALEISHEIEATLSPDETHRLSSARPVVPKAHAALLKGWHFYNQFSANDFALAGRYFREALRHDPDCASAYAGLSDLAWASITLGSALSKADFPIARALANEALRLDPTSAAGHIALGWISAIYEWNWKRAEEEFRRAIDLDPSDSFGYHGLADLFIDLGRFDDALAAAEAAVEHDPFSRLAVWQLASTRYLAGRYDDALASYQHLYEIAPDIDTICDLPTVYFLMGREEDALRAARDLVTKHPTPTNSVCLAYVLARTGRHDEAASTLRQALIGGDDVYVIPTYVALAYFALGDADSAFRWIRKAMDERDYSAVWMNAYPNFKPFRSDPRFGEMVREMGLGE